MTLETSVYFGWRMPEEHDRANQLIAELLGNTRKKLQLVSIVGGSARRRLVFDLSLHFLRWRRPILRSYQPNRKYVSTIMWEV